MKREFHHSAGFVVFRGGRERSFLLVRSALTRRPVWEFPKGALEAGESERDAAVRELEEETGLGAASYRVVEGFRGEEHYLFTRGDGSERRLIRKQVAYFLGEWRAGEVRLSTEATRYVWASRSEAERLLRFAEKRRVLGEAIRFLDQRAGAPQGRPVPVAVPPS